jgi:hypothetical protein
MAYTYSGDPANSDRDWVRFKIGDTDMSDGQLHDAEIDAMLSEKDHRALAAASCAEAVSNKYALLSLRLNDQKCVDAAMRYQRLADRLRSEAAREGEVDVSLPTRSISEKDDALEDSDRLRGRFWRNQHSMIAGRVIDIDGNLS